MRLVLLAAVLASACRMPDPPPITSEWADTFERDAVGSDYLATDGSAYVIEKGMLHAARGYNHPLWLRKKIPRDAMIEVDVASRSPAGDIKVEAWGDGASYAEDKGAYTSTGYVFVHGGWSNSRSVLAKGNEHGASLAERTQPKVELGKTYHWKIERRGAHVDWFVNDMTTPFLSYDDKQALEGPGHEYFGFNDWEADLWFDNLTIRPLP